MRSSAYKILVLFTLLLLAGLTGYLRLQENKGISAALDTGLQDAPNINPGLWSGNTQGFEKADGPRVLRFPADQGPHPDFQTEWWYYTGNLETTDGRHFGYQLTFFRRALTPEGDLPRRGSDWATNQVYMAHFALTDVGAGRFYSHELLARGAANLAGAQSRSYRVWLYNWQVKQEGENKYKLQAAQAGVAIDLDLTDAKGPVLQGDHGYSQKGPAPGDASYYISQTRLVSEGTVEVENELFRVSGLSWMDHEFSTSALASDQVGWDWFSIQLGATKGQSKTGDSGEPIDLMVYQIRKANGSIDPYSSGTLIYPDGSTRHLDKKDFEITSLDTWQSPRTKAKYPSRWTVKIPSARLDLQIDPYLADQELNVSYDYWEGAVKISGEYNGQPVRGNGYVELTGYAASMAGEF
ncbi:MAG TPA: lipocalin-like domain-containing protein [Anaerolineales bacterium]|nr:lipocalin-like domain-containing protein [Anaerolineales bacterium]